MRKRKNSNMPTTSVSKNRMSPFLAIVADRNSGSSNILTHPREIPSLVRRMDDTRATKRAERTERKAAEKAQKEEEARRQKGIKRREMEKQMASLRKDLGIKEGQGTVDWDELEKVMEGDFDEDEWQRVVGKMLESRDDEVSSCRSFRGLADLCRARRRTMIMRNQNGMMMLSRWNTKNQTMKRSRCT